MERWLIVVVSAAFWLGLIPTLGPREATQSNRPSTKFDLSIRRAVEFDAPLALPAETRWLTHGALAIHGLQPWLVTLIPLETPLTPKPRPVDSVPERHFRLARIHLDSGTPQVWKDITVKLTDWPRISASPDGALIVMVLGGEARVMNWDLEVKHVAGWSRLDRESQGFVITRCDFSGQNLVCVLRDREKVVPRQYVEFDPTAGSPRQMVEYDWRLGKIIRSFSLGEGWEDVVPLSASEAVMTRLEAGWNYRYRISEFDLEKAGTSARWKGFAEDRSNVHHFASSRFVFRVERVDHRPKDWITIWRRPPYPYENYPEYTRLPKHTNIFLETTGKVRSWKRGSGKKGPTFAYGRYVLHWPATISHDERFFLVRATHFTGVEDNWVPTWDDERFVVFDVNKPKKPIYISENFGPQEAITGLAFSPDRKTLVVTTSRRLLIYDIKEGQGASRK